MVYINVEFPSPFVNNFEKSDYFSFVHGTGVLKCICVWSKPHVLATINLLLFTSPINLLHSLTSAEKINVYPLSSKEPQLLSKAICEPVNKFT